MHHKFGLGLIVAIATAGSALANDWTSWRGPLQTGESLEHFKDGKLSDKPVWTYDSRSRGTPVICDGKVFSFGYKGEKEELIELLTCLDEKSGKKLWEIEIKDFISDTVYNRYAIGSPAVDPETKRVYLITAYGVFGCWDFSGKEMWRMSMMEKYGRLTFPNSKVGCPVIEGDLVIVRGITANWGADGPAADRFYAFDKITGELVWASTPGESPPTDSSFSTPVFATIDGKRVFFSATGCGNLVCINARNGKALWRHKYCKAGANSTPVIHGDKLIDVQGDENVDTADKGRMIAVKLPTKFGKEQIIFDPSVDKEAWLANEVWRDPIAAASSSPVIVGDIVYQIDEGGAVYALNAATGENIWKAKISNGNTHSSPLYADGLIYAAMMEGKLFVLDAKTGKEVREPIKFEGNCIGSPALCNGQLYVHTTEKLYCLPIENSGVTVAEAPAVKMPEVGPAAALQIIPAEFVISPGEKASFKIRSVDANGFPVGEVKKATWETFIPPTAKVKTTMDAAFDESGVLVAKEGAKMSAGAFKATGEGGIFGIVRGRLEPKPPFEQTFDAFDLKEDHPTEGVKFAYPPLAWIGARFKFDVRELDGNKVFAKTFDRLIFQRAMVFIGTPDMTHYTVEADVMTDGNRRVKSDVGLLNQRYAIVLKGNANQMEVSSNFERLTKTVPFKVEANKWYSMKTLVKVNDDGVTGTVFGKAWEKGQAEPDAWTIEVPVSPVHKEGSPGLFGFTPQNQKRVYIDNVKVTPQK
jgi:outer membrane protein assembly factor BamB